MTNVSRLYNAYSGSRFYYGGVGNSIDYGGFGGGSGWQWDQILDRAMADIIESYEEGMDIDIVGFSRGAAMANELARRLADKNMTVRFLGMFDPVYSKGVAGQSSSNVYQTPGGFNGNYVTTSIPDNVVTAATIYAEHERRSWFPYTQFTHSKQQTRHIAMKMTGQHGEIGGHWQNNRLTGSVTLAAMAQMMEDAGVVGLNRTARQDRNIAAALQSNYLNARGVGGYDETHGNWGREDFLDRSNVESWGIMSRNELANSLTNNTEIKDWAPWGIGVQGNHSVNYAAALYTSPLSIGYQLYNGFQPLRSQFKRDLSGYQHLQDAFPGGGQHFRNMSRKIPNDNGVGWNYRY